MHEPCAGPCVRLGRAVMLALMLAAHSSPAPAFGAMGHRIAAEVAEPLLCEAAHAELGRYGEGKDLAALGLWPDQIRSLPAWRHSDPWHYMNSANDESLRMHRTPATGDVLWAIEYFDERLRNHDLEFRERADALKFLVHFIVDIHQPLHVGLESDRGGNAIAVQLGGRQTNLHSLWDSDIIALQADPWAAYVASVAALAAANRVAWSTSAPRDWAAESKALRPLVYGFDGQPGAAYLRQAGRVIQRRLGQAAVRLAVTLNRVFCDPGAD